MGIFAWIVLGLLAGIIAKLLMPGRDPGGFIVTILIGVAGAALGGWIAAEVFDRPFEKDFFDLKTWGVSVAGALVLLILYRVFFGRSRR
ncbi:GlsB/YeaQ/YmgE family stress response membrane protein [Streptomyces sp. SID3343]|uniref:GlsB/YeaQ/YmgE family stress response membrane protein n=1 Tax=Streptomyces sp. SID3343 TaxID=2690260 RepID=UPI00136DE41F|nr:GlsB/YeaQ/YmgE family stress response membrane protein [Streptomyces sp. SID3343]